mgnify:CR=1 FL=1
MRLRGERPTGPVRSNRHSAGRGAVPSTQTRPHQRHGHRAVQDSTGNQGG